MVSHRMAVMITLAAGLWVLFPGNGGAQTAERLYQKGFELSQEGRYLSAAEAYREALDLKPDWAEAHHGLAVMHFRTGNGPEAAAHFRRALDLYRKRGDPWARDNIPIVERNLELAYKHFALDPDDFSQMETVSGAPTGQIWRRTAFGFLVGPQGYLLAPNHAIESSKRIRIRFLDNTSAAVRLVKRFIVYNIALLRIDDPAGSVKKGLKLGSVANFAPDHAVYSLRAPDLKEPSRSGLARGQLTRYQALENEHNLILSRISLNGPFDGLPLLDASGKVVGMLFSEAQVRKIFRKLRTLPQGTRLAVKAAYLKKILNGYIKQMGVSAGDPAASGNEDVFHDESQLPPNISSSLVIVETSP